MKRVQKNMARQSAENSRCDLSFLSVVTVFSINNDHKNEKTNDMTVLAVMRLSLNSPCRIKSRLPTCGETTPFINDFFAILKKNVVYVFSPMMPHARSYTFFLKFRHSVLKEVLKGHGYGKN
jgi:hypothetical protein